MNVTDYNKKLADAKSDFNRKHEELRTNQKKEVKDLESTYELKKKNQYKNYVNQKLDQEKSLSRHIDRYDAKIDKEIENKTKMFSNRLEVERDKYGKRNQELLQDYNKKLTLLSDSFETKDTERERSLTDSKNRLEDFYDSSLSRKEETYNKRVKDLGKKMESDVAELQLEQDKEKLDMNRRFSVERKGFSESAAKSTNLDRKLHQEEVFNIRNNNADQLESIQASHDSQKKNIADANELARQAQYDTFSESMNKLQAKNVADVKTINEEKKNVEKLTDRKLASVRLQHKKELGSIVAPEDLSAKYNPKTEMVKSYDKRIDNLKDKMESNNQMNYKLNEKASYDHKMEIDQLVENNRDEKLKIVQDSNRQRVNELGDLKTEFENYEESAKKKINNLESEIVFRETRNRKDKNNKLEGQRVQYEQKIRDIGESNQDLLSSIKDEMAKEQTKVFQQVKEDKHHEITELKADLKHSFGLKASSLEKQIESRDNEIESLRSDYEAKLNTLKEMTREQVEGIKKQENDRRIEERHATRREIKFQKIEFDKTATSIKNDFDKKMLQAKSNNDLQIMKLTKRYEDLLRRERTEFSREMTSRQARMNNEIRSATEHHELERDTLIKQYETKLTKLREANRVANELKSMRESDPSLA